MWNQNAIDRDERRRLRLLTNPPTPTTTPTPVVAAQHHAQHTFRRSMTVHNIVDRASSAVNAGQAGWFVTVVWLGGRKRTHPTAYYPPQSLRWNERAGAATVRTGGAVLGLQGWLSEMAITIERTDRRSKGSTGRRDRQIFCRFGTAGGSDGTGRCRHLRVGMNQNGSETI